MITIPATEAKNRFGELLEAANREPVEIAKKGRTVAVMLSAETYRAMQQKIGESEMPATFSGIASWRKKAKKRKSAKPMDEADYKAHLENKYGK